MEERRALEPQKPTVDRDVTADRLPPAEKSNPPGCGEIADEPLGWDVVISREPIARPSLDKLFSRPLQRHATPFLSVEKQRDDQLPFTFSSEVGGIVCRRPTHPVRFAYRRRAVAVSSPIFRSGELSQGAHHARGPV